MVRRGFPNCKIEIYDTSDALTHTITKEIIECHTHDVLTSEVGSFTFTLPATRGFTTKFNDIGNHYKCKFNFGYNGNYTHLFTGRIVPFTSNISPQQKNRIFEGKGLGEELERQFIYNKRWQNEAASDIVTDLSALGLGYPVFADTDIDADATLETITARTSSYFDVLKQVSDYWSDAVTKVQKDYGIDKDGTLYWKARPLRSSGVETFTYGKHFLNYSLKYDITNVKNTIQVFGAPKLPYPSTKDDWTEALDYWTELNGTLSLQAADVKEGTYRVYCAGVLNENMDCRLTPPDPVTLRDVKNLYFWYNPFLYTPNLRLEAPDDANYFETTLTGSGWQWFDGALGETNEYDADENPTGIWTKTGDPNWWDIRSLRFLTATNPGTAGLSIDKLYFYPKRLVATAWDNTSQTNYGKRHAEYTDDQLTTSEEVLDRARTIMYTQKDRILRLDFNVAGNTNVFTGDRLTMTLPPDNISAVAFDVVSVDHHFTSGKQNKWITSIHAIQGDTTRNMPATTPLDSIKRQLSLNRDVNAEIYGRVVR